MTVGEGDRDLELSRVFALTMAALMRRPLTALSLAAVTIALPNELYFRFAPPPPENALSVAFAFYALGSIAVISVSAIFAGWMALQFVGAVKSPLVEVVKRMVPLCVTDLIVMFLFLLGILALFIPGILWSLATFVVIPAAAVERLGPSPAIARSFELTENRRWALLGFSLAILIPPMLAVGLLELALNDWQFFPVEEHPFIANVWRPITDTLQTMLGAALGAALYTELVRLPKLQDAAEAPPGTPTQSDTTLGRS